MKSLLLYLHFSELTVCPHNWLCLFFQREYRSLKQHFIQMERTGPCVLGQRFCSALKARWQLYLIGGLHILFTKRLDFFPGNVLHEVKRFWIAICISMWEFCGFEGASDLWLHQNSCNATHKVKLTFHF